MWASSFIGMCTLTTLDEGWWAFAACVCLAIVGCMPLMQGKHNTLHNIIGALSCLLSQTWVALAGVWWCLVLWWLLYLMLLPVTKTKWCFIAEVWCITSVIILTIMDIWK
jgi:hypothetical protein